MSGARNRSATDWEARPTNEGVKAAVKRFRASVSPKILPEVLQSLPWVAGALGAGYLAHRWIESRRTHALRKIQDQLSKTADRIDESEMSVADLKGL